MLRIKNFYIRGKTMDIKILGSLLIILSGSFLGFLGSLKFSFRVKELNELIQALEFMKVEVGINKLLPHIFEDLSNRENFKIAIIFKNVLKHLKEDSYIDLENAWKFGLWDSMKGGYLKKEDLEIVENLAIMLQKSNLEGQVRNINYLIEKLKGQEKQAVLTKIKNERLFRVGGLLSSVALVIILF